MPTNDSSSSPVPEHSPTSDLRGLLADRYPEVTVWAAGGVVLRRGDTRVEVLLVHRPHRNDWSFPKGKIDDGETLGQTAEREVWEETGLRCRRLEQLPVVRYTDNRDREKLVVYWTMEVEEGEFTANEEVDAAGWFDPVSAAGLLTYTRDAQLLGAVAPGERHLRMLA